MAHFGTAKSTVPLAVFIDELAAEQFTKIKKRGDEIDETAIANVVAETIDRIEKLLDGPAALGIAKSARSGAPSLKTRIVNAQLALASCPSPAERVALKQKVELARAGR